MGTPLLASLFATSSPALAGDEPTRRSPTVTWPRCAQVIRTIDRDLSPAVRLDYDFAGADDPRPPQSLDELPDSRSHQLFALCRARSRDERLPAWINHDDLTRAIELGRALLPVGDDDLLDRSSSWSHCARRIVADDGRLPIIHQRAARGVIWDLSEVPTGTYRIEGYTFDPPVSRWAERANPVVYRIVDRDDPDPPAAQLTHGTIDAYRNESARVFACLRSAAGSSFRGHWRRVGESTGPWIPWLAPAPLPPSGETSLDFLPPPDLRETIEVELRIEVHAPDGRIDTAFSPASIRFVPHDSLDGDGPATPPPSSLPDRETELEHPGCNSRRRSSLRLRSLVRLLGWGDGPRNDPASSGSRTNPSSRRAAAPP